MSPHRERRIGNHRDTALSSEHLDDAGEFAPQVGGLVVIDLIQKERGVDTRELAVPLSGAISNDIESLIARIWDRMERWGLAIPGGYWKPVLKIDVHPEAEHRFRELSALLRDSGMIVERANR